MTLLCRPVDDIGTVTGLHDQVLAILHSIVAPDFLVVRDSHQQ